MRIELRDGQLAFTVDVPREVVMPADEATEAALTWPVGDREAQGDAVDVLRELGVALQDAGLTWWRYGLVGRER